MTFPSLKTLLERFRELGVRQVLCKRLAENDNSKQQIYLGSSFEVLRQLPYQNVRTGSVGKRPNFKAALNFRWIDTDGNIEVASGAQLILYPDYPEVRLSGFLRGTSIGPSAMMRPIPKDLRKFNNGPDGRLLFLGITSDGKVLGFVVAGETAVAKDFDRVGSKENLVATGVFYEIPVAGGPAPRVALLQKLRIIHAAGWHASQRLNRANIPIPYAAPNGGGYTLESLFGIRPNGESAPDYMGWELKAYSQPRITLMTPEPDSGYYGERGVEAFVRKYGHECPGDVLYFTGTHRANIVCTATGQTLKLRGFDPAAGKIVDVTGGIELVDTSGRLAAGWSFEGLIAHWGRKHASAAYVPFTKRTAPSIQYRYESPVLLGEGTDFGKYLGAIFAGHVIYDPGPKVMNATGSKSTVKARSQFRINVNRLSLLYFTFEEVLL